MPYHTGLYYSARRLLYSGMSGDNLICTGYVSNINFYENRLQSEMKMNADRAHSEIKKRERLIQVKVKELNHKSELCTSLQTQLDDVCACVWVLVYYVVILLCTKHME